MTDPERIDKMAELTATQRPETIDTMTGRDFVWWTISFRAPVEATTLREAIDAMIPEENDGRP